jgi:hypothetical protein
LARKTILSFEHVLQLYPLEQTVIRSTCTIASVDVLFAKKNSEWLQATVKWKCRTLTQFNHCDDTAQGAWVLALVLSHKWKHRARRAEPQRGLGVHILIPSLCAHKLPSRSLKRLLPGRATTRCKFE